MNQRSNFTSKIGFVLAAAGSAVGLGNIWRFPYLAAQHGGGTFLLVYLILSVTFGFTLMVAEIAIGRKTGLSAIGAFKALDKRFGFLGVLTSLVPIIILPYYSVIGGWVIKYFATYVSGGAHAAADDSYFTNFIGSPIEPIGWFFLFIALTAVIVLFGVEKGIEKVSKFMMPVLAILTIGIAVYVITRPGAMDGVIYYIKPNFKDFSPTTILAAMGQLFYSMSLAMGIMVTYGSYMKKDNNLESSVRQIEIFDTAIAFLAGLMIVPAAYMFYGGSTEGLKKGPTLMFVILPKVFEEMPGIMGTIIGVAFFLLVFFAALTSSISLMETVVSIIMDKVKWNRKFTCIVVTVFSLIMGIPSSLGFNVWGHITFLNDLTFLDLFDFVSNSVIMPIVAFFTCILVGFIIGPKVVADEVKETDGKFKSEKLFTVMIKWVAPIFILAILAFSVAEGMGWITV
ncbi:MAG: sodium-dependent transporter [Tyzzerella sp.]|nr:sodium-dependent transporter [Tyzzerella sp.]